jgi:hypothetical protein
VGTNLVVISMILYFQNKMGIGGGCIVGVRAMITILRIDSNCYLNCYIHLNRKEDTPRRIIFSARSRY